nr:GH25 family lysozyme [uncultured Flavobacterium sp.]
MNYFLKILISLIIPFNTIAQTTPGIDLSHHIKNIPWEKVKVTPPLFLIHKATEGSSHTDSKYFERKEIAQNYKIPFGAYHFFSYKSSGNSQAKHYIKTAQLSSGNVIPIVDLEFVKQMPTKQQVVTNVKEFIFEIEKQYKVKPIIYCECDFYNQYLKDDFSDLNYWIADYNKTPSCNYVIWQYSKTGKIYGLNGMDLNRLNPNTQINQIILP